mgnify:CR=1 FL=1
MAKMKYVEVKPPSLVTSFNHGKIAMIALKRSSIFMSCCLAYSVFEAVYVVLEVTRVWFEDVLVVVVCDCECIEYEIPSK